MADGGVLFLDEFPEWPRPAREAATHHGHRVLDLHRADGCAAGSPRRSWRHEHVCKSKPSYVCSSERNQYQKRLSGPLLERFTVQLEVGNVTDSAFERPWVACQQWVPAAVWHAHAASQRCEQVVRGHDQQATSASPQGLGGGAHVAHEVTLDVEEAYDVMWMTRPGWRQG